MGRFAHLLSKHGTPGVLLMVGQIIVSALTALGIGVMWALFRRLAPYRHPPAEFAHVPLETLRRKYAAWQLFALLPFFLLVAVFTGLLFLVLSAVHAWWLPAALPGETLISVPVFAWFLPALFLAIFASAVPMHFLFRALLRDRYAEYTHYCNYHFGYDGWRALRWLALAIVIPIAVVLPLALDYYFRFTATSLVSNDLLALGEVERPYSDLVEIRRIAAWRAPNGNLIHHRPYAELQFRDGYTWSSLNWLEGQQAVDELLTLVCDSSGLQAVQWDMAPE